MYKYIRDAWKNPDESYVRELMWQRAPNGEEKKQLKELKDQLDSTELEV